MLHLRGCINFLILWITSVGGWWGRTVLLGGYTRIVPCISPRWILRLFFGLGILVLCFLAYGRSFFANLATVLGRINQSSCMVLDIWVCFLVWENGKDEFRHRNMNMGSSNQTLVPLCFKPCRRLCLLDLQGDHEQHSTGLK